MAMRRTPRPARGAGEHGAQRSYRLQFGRPIYRPIFVPRGNGWPALICRVRKSSRFTLDGSDARWDSSRDLLSQCGSGPTTAASPASRSRRGIGPGCRPAFAALAPVAIVHRAGLAAARADKPLPRPGSARALTQPDVDRAQRAVAEVQVFQPQPAQLAQPQPDHGGQPGHRLVLGGGQPFCALRATRSVRRRRRHPVRRGKAGTTRRARAMLTTTAIVPTSRSPVRF